MLINRADFEYIRQLVRDRTALVLSEDKSYLVASRLAPLMQEAGVGSLQELVVKLRTKPFTLLHQRVIEAMVTTETLFFRDAHPFEAMQKFILPELLQRRQTERSLNIWCAACSSGQEPYSVAMLLREHFPQLIGWQVRLIAGDISRAMIGRAQAGCYSQHEVNRGVPTTLLQKYFQLQGKTWQLNSDIRQMVEFHQFNLNEAWPTLPMMDIILMRNVLIYFDIATKQSILARLRRLLRPDGYLFLGGGETTINLDDAFEPVQFNKAVCYQLRGHYA
ncbi:MAG: protein-glutamate O-methyltransferase CheR [Cyanothece sp. SIO1E1]|nr:protein-glutamate O-methyltransferase CheR [Cyanothece sp. SIO1E1]